MLSVMCKFVSCNMKMPRSNIVYKELQNSFTDNTRRRKCLREVTPPFPTPSTTELRVRSSPRKKTGQKLSSDNCEESTGFRLIDVSWLFAVIISCDAKCIRL